MDVKLTAILCLVLAVLVEHAAADFFYNRPSPKEEDLRARGLNCVPGRTTIKITEAVIEEPVEESDSEDYRRKGHSQRRHIGFNHSPRNERCTICVCSASGTDEYCRKRPALNVNECMIMEAIVKQTEKGDPYDHLKSLSYRIRRDLIWHNDEIPYDPRSRCYRGHSYYTNHRTPNETDINYEEDVTSLLDFPVSSDDLDKCFYCICSVQGHHANCISRDVWFCNYLRYMRSEKSQRDRYASIFQQDRPTYFRQISWRIRRTMDDSMYEFIKNVGGNQAQVRGSSGDQEPNKCVPFVSEYSDCNDQNRCSGCTKCLCSSDGLWQCHAIRNCGDDEAEMMLDDQAFDLALEKLDMEVRNQKRKETQKAANVAKSYVPLPGSVNEKKANFYDSDELYERFNKMKIARRELELMHTRQKRTIPKRNTENKHRKRSAEKNTSVKNLKTTNNTVRFYSTVDELNEDTLKKSNITGTLHANKVELKPLLELSRRSNTEDSSNNSLHIDFIQPKINHISDNKIDVTDHDSTFDLHHEKLNAVLGNHTQKSKDNDLSKIVVTELKTKEVIGDSNATVISNITFTSENDTLTAMAFIAGNLLNKLWNMEKDARGSSFETEDMKQEKISDLLDLFKEPLNLRQEAFLKNALEQLSSAMDKNKNIKNYTICQTIEDATELIDNNYKNADEVERKPTKVSKPCTDKAEEVKQNATIKAISKLNNVLGLLKKFENVQHNLTQLEDEKDLRKNIDTYNNITNPKNKITTKATVLTQDEANSFNTFGNILDKITKLLMPKNNKNKITNSVKHKNSLLTDQSVRNEVMKTYNIDLSNRTLTSKDKLVLDYITHINNNPDCLLNKNDQKSDKSLPTIEGNILLNLSEFFKMKSYADLINLIQPEKKTERPLLRVEKKTAKIPITTSAVTSKTVTETSTFRYQKNDSNKLAATKEKLKAHLKVIIEDLIELQNAKGISPRGNIRIGDALPCIYNIMNAGKEILNKKHEDNSPDKIIDMFNELKHEMKTEKMRRSGSIMLVRPKSAIVLERVFRNLAKASEKGRNSNTRRVAEDGLPKSLDKVEALMNNIRNVSSMYKYKALLTNIPVADRVVLLKTLEKEVGLYISALEGIKESYENISKLPANKMDEFVAFVLTTAQNISLSKRIINKVTKSEAKRPVIDDIETKDLKLRATAFRKPFVKLENLGREIDNDNNNMKISRDQIVNHLIRNRMQLYIKLKEAKGSNDVYYDIAKRVLFYLDHGSCDLAQELYKVLVMQKQDKGIPAIGAVSSDFGTPVRNPTIFEGTLRHSSATQLKPLTQFEEPKILGNQVKWTDQDQLIKQLLNIKNMAV